MTETLFRHPTIGRINRSKRIDFEFNGKVYSGY